MIDHGQSRVVCGYDYGRPCSIQALNFFTGCKPFTEGPNTLVCQCVPSSGSAL